MQPIIEGMQRKVQEISSVKEEIKTTKAKAAKSNALDGLISALTRKSLEPINQKRVPKKSRLYSDLDFINGENIDDMKPKGKSSKTEKPSKKTKRGRPPTTDNNTVTVKFTEQIFTRTEEITINPVPKKSENDKPDENHVVSLDEIQVVDEFDELLSSPKRLCNRQYSINSVDSLTSDPGNSPYTNLLNRSIDTPLDFYNLMKGSTPRGLSPRIHSIAGFTPRDKILHSSGRTPRTSEENHKFSSLGVRMSSIESDDGWIDLLTLKYGPPPTPTK